MLSIDRKAVVERHKVVNTGFDPMGAVTVGNGRFAMTVDATGLQSFPEAYDKGVPLGTQSEWGWHSFVDTAGYKFSEVLKEYTIHGRKVPYAVQWSSPERNKKAADWFRQNLHRLQLGNIGLELTKKDGSRVVVGDLEAVHQELNCWTGEVTSRFVLEGDTVDVRTVGDPVRDGVSVRVRSSLLSKGRLKIRVRLPYPTGGFADDGDNWGNEGGHESKIVTMGSMGAVIRHDLDTTSYFLNMKWSGGGSIIEKEKHYFLVSPEKGDEFEFAVLFSRDRGSDGVAGDVVGGGRVGYAATAAGSAEAWKDYWMKGAMVDLSGSTDPRAFELERRVVLSQYLMRVQEAGDMPPQETGLTYNSWYGKPHLEMHWWHAAHYALWGHPELLERSLDWYAKVVGGAREIAQRQGYDGVRWQKMTDPQGRESPSSVGAFLIWQQPHFVYMAELCYHVGGRPVLEKYKDLVFETADCMASYAWYDAVTRRYILGPGVIPAQERFKEDSTFNPCFELAYWRWALGVAQEWRRRLGLEPDSKWEKVIRELSALPEGKVGGEELYFPTESAGDAYTNPRYRGDHPAVLATCGFLPVVKGEDVVVKREDAVVKGNYMGTKGLDTAMMRRTFDWIWSNWSWKEAWGWDFPMVAMTATRLGMPEKAIDALLMPVQKNTYLRDGHNYQDERLRCYLPGNGGLLSAIALMCAGYDGSGAEPGIPKNGKWKVRWEGLHPAP